MATSSPESLPFDTDVLVIGGGPIGLTTANALRHHGVACRLLEEKPEPSPYSRANNVWARPQELLDSVGLRGPLAERSYLVDRIHLFIDGHPLEDIELDETPSPFPQALYSGQDVMEKTLAEQLAERGTPVERGCKAMRIEPDEQGVTVWVASTQEQAAPRGEFERIRCRYLVGADGAQGTVRKAAGLDYEPAKFKGRANHQVDAKLSWQRSTEPNQLWFFTYHNGFAGVMPVWGGYHRLFFLEDEQLVPDRDPTLAEIQQRAREVIGDETLTLTDPIWLTRSRFQHAVSPAYSKGRVYLVGDAGHFTLPIGGQGMNTGFHDAVGLAWRLAQTLAGQAGPEVLASYSPERQGIHAAVDAEQAKGFEHLLYRNRLEDGLLSTVGHVFPGIGWQLLGSGDGQQLQVNYRESALSEDHLRLRQILQPGVPLAGDRAPDAQVVTNQGETASLFASLYNPDGQTYGWTLLAFDGQQADVLPQLEAAISKVAGWSWVRPRLVLGVPLAPTVATSPTPCLTDRDGQTHRAYRLEGQPALVLVRPDGHVAFRGPADQPQLLRQYCARVFEATAPTSPT